MDSVAGKRFEVIVVGAGPAGSATAIRLALGGAEVLLVERARFPREKLCGEFVSPECARHFRDLGVDELTATNYPTIESTIFYSQRGRSIVFPSDWFESGGGALGISRAEMDAALLEQARGVGVAIRTETAASEIVVEPGTGVRIKLRGPAGETEWAGARIAVDATGRKRSLGSGGTRPLRAGKVAFKTHLRGAVMARNQCEIYSYSGGYGGCNSVGDDLYNLCFIVDAGLVQTIGSDPMSVMRTVLFRNPAARRALENAEFQNEWLAVPVSGLGRRSAVEKDCVFFVGDSAAFIDPFTGSGILLALQNAQICSDAILSGLRADKTPASIGVEYERRYSALLGTRLRVSRMLRPASGSPRLAEIVLALASKSDRLRSMLARATRFSAVPGA